MGIQISSSQEYTVAKLGIGLRPQVRALSILRMRNTIAIIIYESWAWLDEKTGTAMAVPAVRCPTALLLARALGKGVLESPELISPPRQYPNDYSTPNQELQ